MAFNQDEKIDYLKGYRKKQKIFKVIASIIIILLILLNFVLYLDRFMTKARVNIEFDELSIEGWEYEGKVGFYFYNNKNNIVYDVVEDIDNKEIYIILKGMYTFQPLSQKWQSDINQDIERIYIQNKKGDTKLLWNKEEGILVSDITERVQANEKNQAIIEQEILNNINKKKY